MPLAVEGVEEAKAAGKLLKLHGFEFDAVYTSWLSRAIETAWLVLDSMDCLWLPIIKSWRKYIPHSKYVNSFLCRHKSHVAIMFLFLISRAERENVW